MRCGEELRGAEHGGEGEGIAEDSVVGERGTSLTGTRTIVHADRAISGPNWQHRARDRHVGEARKEQPVNRHRARNPGADTRYCDDERCANDIAAARPP